MSTTRVNGADSNAAATAHARVHLKLAALAYNGTRHGADACAEFCQAGAQILCAAAIGYVAALTRQVIDVAVRTNLYEAKNLEIAAIAYCETRHGADTHQRFTTAGLGNLCQTAIAYVEKLMGRPLPSDLKSLAADGA